MKTLLAAMLVATIGAPAAAAPPPAFLICGACHAVLPDKSGVGPSLFGVVGRKAGSVAGFAYSPALAKSGITWSAAKLDAFIASPQKAVPGTRMPFGGLADTNARAAIIAYLATLK